MRQFITACVLILIQLSSFAQPGAKISGQVIETTGKPIVAATVTLVNANDSLTIKKTPTGNDGHFTLQSVKTGTYKLWITHIGYQKQRSNIITIDKQGQSADLGQIALIPINKIQLKEVTINAKKRFVEHKIDRTVVNVDALATNEGISALEVLEKAPGIFVDPNGSISLEGKQGVAVYIDDKKSYLTGADLTAYLQSLPSGALDQIELMTNPPAKYDAAGSGGMINIRLKKSKVKGFNGGLTAIYGHWRYGKIDDSFNFNYRNNKINIFGNVGYNMQNYSLQEDYSRRYLNPDGSIQSNFMQHRFAHAKGYTLGPQLGIDFYQDDKNTLGMLFNGVFKPLNTLSITTTNLLNAGNQPDSSVVQNLNSRRVFNTARTNFNYRHRYDKNGHELSADFDYNFFRVIDNQQFDNATTYPGQAAQSPSRQSGISPSNINIYAFKTDYSQPFKNGYKFETGLKTSYTQTDNLASYFNTVNSITLPDEDKTNHFLYHENINAAYINLSKDWKKLSAQAGLRLENTTAGGHQLGNSVYPDSTFNTHYTSIFPTFYLQYKVDTAEVNQFGFNYGRRINRPFYQDLNPFVIPEDQFTYDAGNPYLRASYSQNLELSHIYKNNLTTKLSYSRSTGDIQQINRLDNGIYYSRPDNIGMSESEGISVNGSINPVKWFTFRGYASLSFDHTQTFLNDATVNTYGSSFYFYGNTQFKFNKGWTTEFTGIYNSKRRTFQSTANAFGRVVMVLQKKLSTSTTIKLTETDLFNTFRYGGVINNLKLAEATYRNTFDTRGFSLNLSYRFGKAINDLRKHDANASGDEQGRVKN
ncbi:outer membrane beta-barrel family protein [Mucilaginibacter sp. OK098]|uniref:outer membrane beta-barrel family protein n=1 Tax=Mucilaginibacter sp. OK098 TaxID=1855297 RepID=UPI00091D2D7F|nr:outer membrane beta-barrel family protein [Mucilaginibacter sp. OK098]SHN36432.1 Carboxypeptidase regulatory-like domain-containing protein [Mucilaginibacter sp. OK098]